MWWWICVGVSLGAAYLLLAMLVDALHKPMCRHCLIMFKGDADESVCQSCRVRFYKLP